MIEITLPWPPSVNTYWRNFDGRMIISARGREYRETVGDQMTLLKCVLLALKGLDCAKLLPKKV